MLLSQETCPIGGRVISFAERSGVIGTDFLLLLSGHAVRQREIALQISSEGPIQETAFPRSQDRGFCVCVLFDNPALKRMEKPVRHHAAPGKTRRSPSARRNGVRTASAMKQV